MATNSNRTGAASPDPAVAAARVEAQLRKLIDEGLPAGLHLVSTPIGNLGDVTLRAIAALACADAVFCEDTRRARKLLSHFGIERALHVYEDHSAERVRPRVMDMLRAGRSVALMSDAGTPLISDPGFKLVRAAVEERIGVFSVPGPVAAAAALTVSGLPSDKFHFAGFLPAKSVARRDQLGGLAGINASLIFYESPARVPALLEDVGAVLGPRPTAVLRELTKRFEEHLYGTPEELRAQFAEHAVKGEVVVVVGPPLQEVVSDDVIWQRLQAAMVSLSPRDSVNLVAKMLDVQRKRVYQILNERFPDPGTR